MFTGQTSKLSRIMLLADVPKEQMKKLEKRCSWRNFTSQEQIIDRESKARDVYFVIMGKVRVVNFSSSGREVAFDEISAGGYFGENAAIDGKPRSATGSSRTPLVCPAQQPPSGGAWD